MELLHAEGERFKVTHQSKIFLLSHGCPDLDIKNKKVAPLP